MDADVSASHCYPKTAKPAAPYTFRAPSPPTRVIPAALTAAPIKVVPRYDNIDPASLSVQDLAIITQNGVEQVAQDAAPHWIYESRRTAQPILDYLYLGPSSVLRDRSWLQKHGITMILAVRDARQASLNLMAFDQLAQDMSIEPQYVDVSGNHELIRAFPTATRLINDHMLRIYHQQAMRTSETEAQDGNMSIDEANFQRGRVLVVCETGNGRSASIVSAYLMAVLGMSMIQACQFVNYIRFCVGMDEQLKHTLTSYEDILLAQRTVHQYEFASNTITSSKTKRRIEETMDDDDPDVCMSDVDKQKGSDHERFSNRDVFAPFLDIS